MYILVKKFLIYFIACIGYVHSYPCTGYISTTCTGCIVGPIYTWHIMAIHWLGSWQSSVFDYLYIRCHSVCQAFYKHKISTLTGLCLWLNLCIKPRIQCIVQSSLYINTCVKLCIKYYIYYTVSLISTIVYIWQLKYSRLNNVKLILFNTRVIFFFTFIVLAQPYIGITPWCAASDLVWYFQNYWKCFLIAVLKEIFEGVSLFYYTW